MAKHLKSGSLGLRVAMFFAWHQGEEELTTKDVSVKFDVNVDQVRSQLRRPVRDGVLDCKSTSGGRGLSSVYSAGPAIFEMVGVTLQACAPVPMACLPVRVGVDSGFDMTI